MAYSAKQKSEILKNIVKYIEEGSSREDACGLVKLARSTFYLWVKKSDISDTIKKAEETNKRRMIVVIQNAALKNWTAAAWWLERRFSAEYALRQKFEHSGKGGGPIEINHSLNEALKRIYGKKEKQKRETLYNEEEVKDLLDPVRDAFEAGVPQDQVKQFLDRLYVPLPWQWKFHALAREADLPDGPTQIAAGGARGPGKSHVVFTQITLDDCQRVPGLKGLFIRQTGGAAKESFSDLVMKVLTGKVEHEHTANILRFPNGSRVVLGGFHNEDDIDKYIGIEYDVIAVEELNQLTEEKVNKLRGSLRTSKPNWRPRFYTSFNPGGKGHSYVKDTFVTPFHEKREGKIRYVPATYKDNLPYLNKEYIEYLEELPGDLGRAWREGNFDLFEGQFFKEWSRDKHVVPAFKIADTWRRFLGIDFGSTKPFAAYWIAIDWDQNYWVYKEYYQEGKNAEQNAKGMLKLMAEDERVEFAVADSGIFSKQGYGETIADILQRNGIGQSGTRIPMLLPSMKGPKSREARAQLLHQKLFWNAYTKPKIRFFETCVKANKTIPALQYSETNPEDVDTDMEDHAYDAVTYLLQKLEEVKTDKPRELMTNVERKLEDLKQLRSPSIETAINKRFNEDI